MYYVSDGKQHFFYIHAVRTVHESNDLNMPTLPRHNNNLTFTIFWPLRLRLSLFLLFGLWFFQVDFVCIVITVFLVGIQLRRRPQCPGNSRWLPGKFRWQSACQPEYIMSVEDSDSLLLILTSNGSASTSKKLKKLPDSAGKSSASPSSSLTRGCNFVRAVSGSFQLILVACNN